MITACPSPWEILLVAQSNWAHKGEGRQSYCDRNVKGREELALASPT